MSGAKGSETFPHLLFWLAWNEEHRRAGDGGTAWHGRGGTEGFGGRERNRVGAGGESPPRAARQINIYSAAGFISHAFRSYFYFFSYHVAVIGVFFPPTTVMETRCSPCEEADLHRRSESVRTLLKHTAPENLQRQMKKDGIARPGPAIITSSLRSRTSTRRPSPPHQRRRQTFYFS